MQMNGTAKVSLTGEVTWTNRIITMTAGVTPQEPSGYHDISMPAVGSTVAVQGGGTRTIVAATAGQSGQSGGVLLNPWETLWYRIVRGSSNTTIPGNFLITYYLSNATTSAPGILNPASFAGGHAGEWVRVVSRDDGNKFTWFNGDAVGLGGQFGGSHDLTIANWTAMKNRVNGNGYFFATFASATPTRVGFTGVIRWIDAGSHSYVNSQGYVDSNPSDRANGVTIYGVNGAASRTWQTLTAADAIEKFGGARTGNSPITATSTVVQLSDNETLYYAASIDNTGPSTGTWYVASYSGNNTIPVHWLPVMSHQVTGADSTTQVLLGGVQRSLRSGDAVWMGKVDGDLDRLHRRMGVTYQGLKYTRFTTSPFFSGAAANGLLGSSQGVMVSWATNRMMYGISDGYASWGNQYTYINVPAVGTQIPVVSTTGATTVTRVVTAISGRAYVPLGVWESLWFIPAAYTSGTGSSNGDFVISYYNGNHNVPIGAVRVAHVNASAGLVGTGADKTRVFWADNTVTQPGWSYAVTGLAVENDQAQGSGDWRLVTVAGSTPPGATAALPAVAGIGGPYGAPFTANYRYLTSENDPRGQIEVEGLILCNANITVASPNIAFMNGVRVRGNPITMAQMNRSTLGDDKPIPVQLRWTNGSVGGQNGVLVSLYTNSGAGASNPYATLGVNGGTSPAGVAQWISLGPIVLPHE
jgi:hypothetical protein